MCAERIINTARYFFLYINPGTEIHGVKGGSTCLHVFMYKPRCGDSWGQRMPYLPPFPNKVKYFLLLSASTFIIVLIQINSTRGRGKIIIRALHEHSRSCSFSLPRLNIKVNYYGFNVSDHISLFFIFSFFHQILAMFLHAVSSNVLARNSIKTLVIDWGLNLRLICPFKKKLRKTVKK